MLYRYSNRVAWSTPENSFSALVSELQSNHVPLLDLTISNPTKALADYPHADIAAALGAISGFTYQPEPFGDWAARAAIVSSSQRRLPRVRLKPSQIALTASTSEAYSLLFKLLANPGDEVLAPAPSYPLFDHLAQLEIVNLKPYRLAYDGSWHIDFVNLEESITPRTRAIILVNPNNPTGSFLKASEWARLRSLATANHLPLISDEVFMEYTFDDSAQRVSTLCNQDDVLTFTLNGLSKSAGMPQMKLSWITVTGPAAEREQACARLELLLDTYLSVGAPVQLASERLLQIGDLLQHAIRIRTRGNLSKLRSLLLNQAVTLLHLEGGWSAILRVPAVWSEEEWITRLLREHRTIMQPGYFFDMPGEPFLVVSLLPEEQVFEEGIVRLLVLAATRL